MSSKRWAFAEKIGTVHVPGVGDITVVLQKSIAGRVRYRWAEDDTSFNGWPTEDKEQAIADGLRYVTALGADE